MRKDNFYNLILEHRLPLNRNDESMKEFLEGYYSNYIEAYKKALVRTDVCTLREECYQTLGKELTTLEELCDDILKILNDYNSANMPKLYYRFESMMEKISYLMPIQTMNTVGHKWDNDFYRIRTGPEEFSRAQLFHIPFTKRELIKPYRYSIQGYPCLYLSDSVEMCWFECGMPKKFSYAKFCSNTPKTKELKLLDFTTQPIKLIQFIRNYYINHPEDVEFVEGPLVKYVVLFPLIAACSLEVADRDKPFVEEYIFPQQLLLWVRNQSSYDGIAYRTCSSIKHAGEWNGVNIVLPAKSIKDDYCEYLNELFTVTKPVQVKLKSIFKNKENGLQEVEKILVHLQADHYNCDFLYLRREIISLINTFLCLISMLKTDRYIDANAIYQTMDFLNLTASILLENKQMAKKEALDKAKNYDYRVSEENANTEFDKMISDFENIIWPIMLEFRNYAKLIEVAFPYDENSCQHIF